jgi:hypothetical protein
MAKNWTGSLPAQAVCALLIGTTASAAPWDVLLPFKKVDADPKQAYGLTKEQGPWLILAASFSGDEAERQAHELVIELRSRFNLPAYTHKQTYDFTQPVQGMGWDEFGNPKQMRYNTAVRYDTVAVLVGDFPSIEDPNMEKTLEKIKYARPESLDIRKRPKSVQRFAGLRELYRQVTSDPEKRKRGPMGMAFATRNPLLPEEYFVSRGLDPFIVEMNQDLEFSLLKCKARYSVRVATFRGQGTMNVKQMASSEVSDELDKAAEKAHKLVVALRKKGVEAYEFHDRFESIVTIGSFDSLGQPLPDGRTDLAPAILKLLEDYGPERLPSVDGQQALRPKSINGITFDAQPWPVETPQVAFGAAYSEGNRRLNF